MAYIIRDQKDGSTVTATYRVYGADGHRQRESFNDSYTYDFSTPEETRVIEVRNADKTGTNDYTELVITRDSMSEVEAEINGQITDGIFENSVVGRVECISMEENPKTQLDYMEEHPDENLGWCRPFVKGKYFLVLTDGYPTMISLGDKTIENPSDEDIQVLAKAVCEDYDDFDGWSDISIATCHMMERGCADCPMKHDCEAMNVVLEEA